MDSAFSMSWIPPILAYCSASISMTLINKLVLSGFTYKPAFAMLAVQSIASVLLLEIFTFFGWARHRGLNKPDVKRWIPVSLLMALMLYTGSKSLQHLSVPVFTIFKNLSIIIVAYGEFVLFRNQVTRLMLISFMLMVLSSVIAASADFSSSNADSANASSSASILVGYLWMATNCVSSASFVLYMRYSIRHSGPEITPFKDFDTVFYNNLLTAPIFLFMSLVGADGSVREIFGFYGSPENSAEFHRLLLALFFSGISAFWISYASSWCIRVTNSTTYSMVGALNKLPIAVSGMIFFPDSKLSLPSVLSVLMGFASGIIYTKAKINHGEISKIKKLPITRDNK